MRKRLSEIHPALYQGRIGQKRMFRRISDSLKRTNFASEIREDCLAYSCKRHQSLLRRKLGDSDPLLQENKIINLKIACPTIDGVVIYPGQTFSFWHLVGEATAEKGYAEGMQLSRGEVIHGIGGGLCQLANLLYWMAFHTPLEIIERHHHSFDPFPDENRVLPFGSGAGIFYNYIDLRFFNRTESAFQIRVGPNATHLKGSIYSDHEMPNTFHVFEKNHRFLKQGNKNFRENEIWRRVVDRRSGVTIREELLVKNCAEVKYELNFAVEPCNV